MTPITEVMWNLSSRFSLISMADVGMVEMSIPFFFHGLSLEVGLDL
jgi:hypothetical protein